MPIYLYWGEDEFAIAQAASALQTQYLDPQWASFNYDKVIPDQADGVIQGLNLAMTPVFGVGCRLVWLVDTTLTQQCSEPLLAELERTLPVLPETSVVLLTSRNKPDGRLKSTKLLQKWANIREFSLIPPWKTDLLLQQVRQVAQETGVKLTTAGAELLAQAVGNNTRQLFCELEKLRLYSGEQRGQTTPPLDAAVIASLVIVNTQSSLQLAAAIRQRQTAQALELVIDLINRNEPALRIVATLVGQFRIWLWVKLMVESGVRDEAEIARAAEVSNPKRIYFLQQEVKPLSLRRLRRTLGLLLDLETRLKQGAEEVSTLQTKIIELCQ
ncbi:DNA polymerase III subunit delta [Neosynechococcus sphagnicola sy1]|uniref:DNA polymerase III subunit delta n=1 Tax=Neosynechococcus sphagnicola sy1 TaxID=1497020 RepID=A0A098TLA8_9CYAN|nr:DNA polymerase III subunit delta [Neosynechococcus sphagnicola]KGF73079.1 DNA polymerase III subunit delta [Neosynechococcus sphagnicola sy1]